MPKRGTKLTADQIKLSVSTNNGLKWTEVWKAEGTGEVTENLFTMYVFEEVCGMPASKAHGAIADAERAVDVDELPSREAALSRSEHDGPVLGDAESQRAARLESREVA